MEKSPSHLPQELKDRLRLFDQMMIVGRVLAGIGNQIFSDFPNNLPLHHRDLFQDAMKIERDRLVKDGLPWVLQDDGSWTATPSLPEIDKNVSSNDLFRLVDLRMQNPDATAITDQLPLEQFVIVALSQTEAMLSELLGWILRQQPKLLRSSRKIEWADIMDCGDWNKLTAVMIERLCIEKSFLPIVGRLKYLSDIGVDHDVNDPKALEQIDFAERARHLFCHSGGFVSEKFVSDTKTTKYKVGDRLTVTIEYCRGLSGFLMGMVHHLAERAVLKFGETVESV